MKSYLGFKENEPYECWCLLRRRKGDAGVEREPLELVLHMILCVGEFARVLLKMLRKDLEVDRGDV